MTVIRQYDLTAVAVSVPTTSILVWARQEQQVVTGAAVTSLTFSSLDGDAHDRYWLQIYWVVGAGPNASLLARINNDSGANYGRQAVSGQNVTASASRNTGATSVFLSFQAASGQRSEGQMWLEARTGQPRLMTTSETRYTSGTTVDTKGLIGQVWNNTATNITSLVLLSDVASGIGIGSVFTLWRQRTVNVVT